MPKPAKLVPPSPPENIDFSALKRPALAQLWQATFGRPLSPKIRRPLAAQVLRFHANEVRHGPLPPEVEAYLASLLPKQRGSGPQPTTTPVRRLRPGTRLLRAWRGQTYTVTVDDPGFLYDGKAYKSLSVIAREITGTPWSGPAFFGLKQSNCANRRA